LISGKSEYRFVEKYGELEVTHPKKEVVV